MEKPQVKFTKMSPYSSSLNDAEWAVVETLLNELLPNKKQTRPPEMGLSHPVRCDALPAQKRLSLG